MKLQVINEERQPESVAPKRYWCIYRVTNNVNGKTYIGQHKYADEKNVMGRYKGGGIMLHYAYKKYGEENFSTEILYKRIRDKETADAMEIWMIAKERKENKNGCYNIANGGQGGYFIPHSEETRRKISEALKGKPSSRKGSHHSEEAKEKNRQKHIGKPTWNKGKKVGHWYNNGTVSVQRQECPEGFVPGRLDYNRRKSS